MSVSNKLLFWRGIAYDEAILHTRFKRMITASVAPRAQVYLCTTTDLTLRSTMLMWMYVLTISDRVDDLDGILIHINALADNHNRTEIEMAFHFLSEAFEQNWDIMCYFAGAAHVFETDALYQDFIQRFQALINQYH